MYLVSLSAFILLASSSASVVPIESSSVNVQHSGQDYSYTINENHGIAIEPLPHQPIPVIKIAPGSNMIKQEHIPIKDQQIKPIQPQLKSAQIPTMGYALPLATVPTYTYLPAHQYAIPIPYGINYPYNLIANI